MVAWSFVGPVAVLWPTIALAAPSEQCAAYPLLSAHWRAPTDFVPPGWRIEAQVAGELKEASRPAIALVLRRVGSSSPQPNSACDNQRIFAVLLESPAQSYSLAVQNHTLIPTFSGHDEQLADIALGDGAKVPALEIKRGSLLLHLNLTYRASPIAGQNLTFSFRYRDGRLYLIGYDDFIVSQVTAGTQYNHSYNFLTGRAHLSSWEEDCTGCTVAAAGCLSAWKRIKRRAPLTIDEVGDATLFNPSIY
jgi:hypothetical protein